jgi:hypothetical protein
MGSGVRDLREKLSGTMHPQPSNADPRKVKPVSEIVKVTRRENADERPVRQSKKVAKPSSSKKTSQPKVCILLVVYVSQFLCFLHVPEFHLPIGFSRLAFNLKHVLLELTLFIVPSMKFVVLLLDNVVL